MKNDLLKRPDYYHIPLIVGEQVPPHEAFVWAVVYWFERMKDGRCFASNERIAEALPYNSSVRSVANAIQVLATKGLIRCIYRDETKRNRIEINVLVGYEKKIDDAPTGASAMHPQVHRDAPTGVQNSKRDIVKGILTSEADASQGKKASKNTTYNPLGAEVIHAFSELNPAAKTWYGNKTQRKACDNLISDHGLEQVQKIIAILGRTNMQPYFPCITTPAQLHAKWAQLETACKRKKSEIITKKSKVAFV